MFPTPLPLDKFLRPPFKFFIRTQKPSLQIIIKYRFGQATAACRLQFRMPLDSLLCETVEGGHRISADPVLRSHFAAATIPNSWDLYGFRKPG